MKKWTLILSGFFLVLSFQNCQQSHLPNSNEQTAAPAEFEKTSASSYPTVQMWDYDRGRTIDIEVATGKMAVYLNYGTDRGQDLCLSEAEQSELQGLLTQSEICRPVLPPEQFLNQTCSQLYRYPYAVLVDRAEEIRLGEMTNGCDVPTDLCGAKGANLQSYVQRILKTLEQHLCR